jgi:hypothetical protein
MPEATAPAAGATDAGKEVQPQPSAISQAAPPAQTPEEIAAAKAAEKPAQTPEEIAAAKAAEKAAEKPVVPTVEEQRKFLADKGGKPEDLAKLSEADLKKQYDAAKTEADKAADKPIEYKDFKFPEGVKPDEKMMGDFKGIMAKAKVPQEVAQELIDLYGKQLQGLVKAPYEQWRQTQAKWQGDMLKDTEIGGSQEALDENLSYIAKMIDVIGDRDAAAIRQAFDITGAGNNPVLAKFLVRIGKFIAEGGPTLAGGPAVPDVKNPASVLYPNQGAVKQGNAA